MLGLLRRTARAARVPLAVVFLGSSLVIYSPSTAAAFVPGPTAEKAGLFALKTVAPRAVPFIATGPAGWIAGAGMLAWTAYDTREYWMPMVQGSPDGCDPAQFNCGEGNVIGFTGPGMTIAQYREWAAGQNNAFSPSSVVQVVKPARGRLRVDLRCDKPPYTHNASGSTEWCRLWGGFGQYYFRPETATPNRPGYPQYTRNPDATWVLCQRADLNGGKPYLQRPASGSHTEPQTGASVPNDGTRKTLTGNGQPFSISLAPCGTTGDPDVLGYTHPGGYDARPNTNREFGYEADPGIDWGDPIVDPNEGSENRVRVDCTNTAGDVQQITSTNAASRNGQDAVARIPSCRDELGDGWRPKRVRVKHVPGYGKDNPAYVDSLPEFDASESPDPLWDPCRASGCITTVVIGGEPCSTSRAICSDWPAEYAANPGNVQCKIGPNVVPVAQCDVLSDAYKTDAPPRVWARPKPSPLTPTPAPAEPVTKPAPEKAPEPRPEDETATSPQPTPTPTPSPGMGTTPGGAGQPDPARDPDGEGSRCFPTGWAVLNPVEWVYQPVKCALQWAFVPSPAGIQAGLGQTVIAWRESSPARWFSAVGGIFDDLSQIGAGSGCEGPALTVDQPLAGTKTYRPLAACEGVGATIATIVRTAAIVAVYSGAAVVSARVIGAAFGLNLNGVAKEAGE